jgi:hypothetical protein
VLAPDDRGAALYSGPLPHKYEPTATISGKSLTGRTGMMIVLSSPIGTVPAIPCAPHPRGRDCFPARRKRCSERRLSPKEHFRTPLLGCRGEDGKVPMLANAHLSLPKTYGSAPFYALQAFFRENAGEWRLASWNVGL